MTDDELVEVYDAADVYGHIDGLRAVAARARAEAMEEAAKIVEDADVVQFTHALVLYDDGRRTLGDAAAAIRARAAEGGERG